MKKTLTLILITLFSYSFVFSQNNSTKKADRLFDRFEFVKAAEEYLKLSDSELSSKYVMTNSLIVIIIYLKQGKQKNGLKG